MILRLAFRSLALHPVRTAVLACGFGLGIGVMAVLLGVGEVIMDQARSPALQGGGDLVISGAFGPLENSRFVTSSVLGTAEFRPRIAAASPSVRRTLFLIKPGMALPIAARGGIPSLEKAVRDPEVLDMAAWSDAPGDARWSRPEPGDLLRSMDRFHPPPDVPEFAGSWAEWLYFNGRTADGRARFYLTFLVGPSEQGRSRRAGVRLQLDRDGRQTSYSSAGEIDGDALLENAPDIDVAGNHVRLEGLTYRITLRLRPDRYLQRGAPLPRGAGSRELTGGLVLDSVAGRSLPPAVIHGARGWLSGYVVPVLSGTIHGGLVVDGQRVSLEGASGYHDHNWGFWQGVRWQWGQVSSGEISIVYGRVLPPASVADAERMPGFAGVLGPDGPIGMSTDVSIVEREGDPPPGITVISRSHDLDLRLQFSTDHSTRTRLALTRSMSGPMTDFLQLVGTYHVSGQVGDRSIDFSARGAAETFR